MVSPNSFSHQVQALYLMDMTLNSLTSAWGTLKRRWMHTTIPRRARKNWSWRPITMKMVSKLLHCAQLASLVLGTDRRCPASSRSWRTSAPGGRLVRILIYLTGLMWAMSLTRICSHRTALALRVLSRDRSPSS